MDQKIFNSAVEIRKHIHQNPEVSGQEKNTSDFIYEVLIQLNVDEIIRFKNYGIIAIKKGGSGSKVLLRADFDALQIEEINDFEHKSNTPGVSHKCGHDGHTASLLAYMMLIKDQKPDGDIYALFQPSEETGTGAREMTNAVEFERIKPDFAISYHNLPGYKLNEIICKSGDFTAAVNSMIISLQGKTSHAAEPENGINPALAISELIQMFNTINNPDGDSPDFTVVTPVYSKLGEESYGVSAGYGEIHFTIRTWSNKALKKVEKQLEEISNQISEKYGLGLKIHYMQSFSSNKNDEYLFNTLKKTTSKLNLDLKIKNYPFKWGEDFGVFTQKIPGLMFCVGAGEDHPSLHNPDYDFPDELIKTSSRIYKELVKALQKEK